MKRTGSNKRIAKLESVKEQAERIAVGSKKNEENATKLAEEEGARAEEERVRAEELGKNEQITKKLAVEERRKRLEAEAEVHELRVKLRLPPLGLLLCLPSTCVNDTYPVYN